MEPTLTREELYELSIDEFFDYASTFLGIDYVEKLNKKISNKSDYKNLKELLETNDDDYWKTVDFLLDKNSFTHINRDIVFLKPELRLLLEAHGKYEEGMRFLKIIDAKEVPRNNFEEYFNHRTYQIVECNSEQMNQLSWLLEIPEVVVCHHTSKQKGYIQSRGIKVLIFVCGEGSEFELLNKESDLMIISTSSDISFTHNDGKIDYDVIYFEKGRKFKALTDKNSKIQIDGTTANNNAEYLISTTGDVSVSMKLTSCFKTKNRIRLIKVTDGQGARYDTMYFIIHGYFNGKDIIKVDREDTVHSGYKVVFPDMSERELKNINADANFFTPDALFPPSMSTVMQYHRKYLSGSTFSEMVYPEETDKETLSSIDSFLRCTQPRKSNPDNFKAMEIVYIDKVQKEVKTGRVREIESEIVSKSEILSIIDDRLLARAEELGKIKSRVGSPYINEVHRVRSISAVEKSIAERVRAEENFYEIMRFYSVEEGDDPVFRNEQAIYVKLSPGAKCVIESCDIVFLEGEGEASIYGNLHTLVNQDKVKITFNNVEDDEVDMNLYLFADKGSLYNSIRKYSENVYEMCLEVISSDEHVYYDLPEEKNFDRKKTVILNFRDFGDEIPFGFYTASIKNYQNE